MRGGSSQIFCKENPKGRLFQARKQTMVDTLFLVLMKSPLNTEFNMDLPAIFKHGTFELVIQHPNH